MSIPIDQWSFPHWELLNHIDTYCYFNADGTDRGDRTGAPERVLSEEDWSLVCEFVREGLLESLGTKVAPKFRMTRKGEVVTAHFRAYFCTQRWNYDYTEVSEFVPNWDAIYGELNSLYERQIALCLDALKTARKELMEVSYPGGHGGGDMPAYWDDHEVIKKIDEALDYTEDFQRIPNASLMLKALKDIMAECEDRPEEPEVYPELEMQVRRAVADFEGKEVTDYPSKRWSSDLLSCQRFRRENGIPEP